MPGSTPLQLYAYPLTTDQAAPAGIQTLAQAIEKQVVALFPDTATRDSRWTAATGLANGALCFINSSGELQLRAGGAWVVIGGRASSFAMAQGTAGYSLTAVSNVNVSITFPAGRFSVAPILDVYQQSAGGGSNSIVFRPVSITTTGASVNCATYNLSSVTVSAEVFGWTALQMTSAAAAG